MIVQVNLISLQSILQQNINNVCVSHFLCTQPYPQY